MNRPDKDLVEGFVNEVRDVHKELDTERSHYMTKCKQIRARFDDIKERAVDAGLGKRAFSALVKVTGLDIKIERIAGEIDEIPSKLEHDEEAEFRLMVEALSGDFGETPLAKSAIDRAKKRRQEKAKVVSDLVQ